MKRTGTFELFKDKARKYRFNLNASNGQVILSSDAYASRAGCLRGIDSTRRNSQIGPRYWRSVARDGQHYFTLMSSNGRTLGRSELYSTESSMENGINSVSAHAPDARMIDR